MKQDEIEFLIEVYKTGCSLGILGSKHVREVIIDMNINQKRATYLLCKWCNKDLYEYGVCLDLGWLTDKGLVLAKDLINKRKGD